MREKSTKCFMVSMVKANIFKECEAMYNKEEIEKIIGHFGQEKQIVLANEEMAELIQANSKVLRNCKVVNLNNLIEEIADVSLMLDQLMVIYDIRQTTVKIVKKQKIERTLKIIQNEKENVK